MMTNYLKYSMADRYKNKILQIHNNTFHFGFPSVSEETSSIKDESSLNMISHASKCERPRAMVAACYIRNLVSNKQGRQK